MRMCLLKLILRFRSGPNDDSKLRELIERFGLIERFTPYVAGGRGALRGVSGWKGDETRPSLN
jgi:hypothetical protein